MYGKILSAIRVTSPREATPDNPKPCLSTQNHAKNSNIIDIQTIVINAPQEYYSSKSTIKTEDNQMVPIEFDRIGQSNNQTQYINNVINYLY